MRQPRRGYSIRCACTRRWAGTKTRPGIATRQLPRCFEPRHAPVAACAIAEHSSTARSRSEGLVQLPQAQLRGAVYRTVLQGERLRRIGFALKIRNRAQSKWSLASRAMSIESDRGERGPSSDSSLGSPDGRVRRGRRKFFMRRFKLRRAPAVARAGAGRGGEPEKPEEPRPDSPAVRQVSIPRMKPVGRSLRSVRYLNVTRERPNATTTSQSDRADPPSTSTGPVHRAEGGVAPPYSTALGAVETRRERDKETGLSS